jgi:hypothetical protein
LTIERQLTVFRTLLSRKSENSRDILWKADSGIVDYTEPGQFPESLRRHGTAGWWTWSGKPKRFDPITKIGLIADIRTISRVAISL